MTLTTLVFTLLLALPKFHADTETDLERSSRTLVLAQAMVSASEHATCTGAWADADWCTAIWPASEQLDLVLLLVTQGFWESRFAYRVHADRCLPTECDSIKLPNGTIYHRSKSVWQIQRTRVVPEWNQIGGLGEWSTYSAAYASAKVLAMARGRCAREATSWELGAVSGYAGYVCNWPGAGRRVQFLRVLRAKAAALMLPPAEKRPAAVASRL